MAVTAAHRRTSTPGRSQSFRPPACRHRNAQMLASYRAHACTHVGWNRDLPGKLLLLIQCSSSIVAGPLREQALASRGSALPDPSPPLVSARQLVRMPRRAWCLSRARSRQGHCMGSLQVSAASNPMAVRKTHRVGGLAPIGAFGRAVLQRTQLPTGTISKGARARR